MKIVFLRLLAIVMILVASGCAKSAAPPPKNSGNLGEDIVQWAKWSGQENKFLLLYFRSDECDYCKQLDQIFLKKDILTTLGDHYVQQRVGMRTPTQNIDIYQLYMGKNVRGVPALAILKEDATVKVAVTGAEWGESDQEAYDYIKAFLTENIEH